MIQIKIEILVYLIWLWFMAKPATLEDHTTLTQGWVLSSPSLRRGLGTNDWLMDWLMDGVIDWLIDGWMDGWMDWWIDGLMDWWIDGLMDWCMDWWIDDSPPTIATSAKVTPNGGLVREYSQNTFNSGIGFFSWFAQMHAWHGELGYSSTRHAVSCFRFDELQGITPQKTNMSPENEWLEDVFPIQLVPF